MLIQSDKIENFSSDQEDLKSWEETRNKKEKEFTEWEIWKRESCRTNNTLQNTQQQWQQTKQNEDDNEQKRWQKQKQQQ